MRLISSSNSAGKQTIPLKQNSSVGFIFPVHLVACYCETVVSLPISTLSFFFFSPDEDEDDDEDEDFEDDDEWDD